MFHSRENSAQYMGRRELRLGSDGTVRQIRRRALSGRTLAAGFVMLICAVGAGFGPWAATDQSNPLSAGIRAGSREAFYASHPFVAARVPNLGSVDFPDYSDEFVEWLGGSRFCVSSYLLDSSGDGPVTQIRFTCTLRQQRDHTFCLDSLTFEPGTRLGVSPVGVQASPHAHSGRLIR